jgi:hypothetical protein
VSAAIRKSLNKLNSAVEKLEGAIEAKKASPGMRKGGQASGTADLFSAAPSAPSMNPAHVKMLANRLDTAINQVELILKEGRG